MNEEEQRKRAERFMTPPSVDPTKKRKSCLSLEEMCKDKGIEYIDETKQA